jgi:3-dehydroquinate synthase
MKVKINKKKDSYEILFTNQIVNGVFDFLYSKYSKVAIITDSKVKKLIGEDLSLRLKQKGLDCSVIAFPHGEVSKNLETAKGIMELMVEKGFDRKSAIVALGGGVTIDLAGFISASFLRGIDYVTIPTTVISMVDSSVGGKISINLDSGRNLIGCFNHPKRVFINTEYIDSLPERHIKNGLFEIIKFGIVKDKKVFEIVEESSKILIEKNFSLFNEIIEKCLEIKADLMNKDLRILSFGHIFGKVIENEKNSLKLHGEAIGKGMFYESKIALELDLLDENDFIRIRDLLEDLGIDLKIDKTMKFEKDVIISLPSKIGSISESKRFCEEELLSLLE